MIRVHGIYRSSAMLVFLCGPLEASMHRHYASQLIIALGRPFALRTDRGEPCERSLALVPPNLPHTLSRCSDDHLFVLFNPLTSTGLRLGRESDGAHGAEARLASFPFEAVRRCARGLRSEPNREDLCAELVGLLEAWVAALPLRPVDDRVLQVIRRCRRSEAKRVSLKELARSVHLSESRLLHLFARETGVPVRRYLKWLRTLDAVRRVMAGDVSLTQAAVEVGFADSAHFSRTFREMFGVPPSYFLRAATWTGERW